MNQIILVFNETNNFDVVSARYGSSGDMESLIKESSWAVRNFYCSVASNYEKSSPRRVEAELLALNLLKQIYEQTPEELKEDMLSYCSL